MQLCEAIYFVASKIVNKNFDFMTFWEKYKPS